MEGQIYVIRQNEVKGNSISQVIIAKKVFFIVGPHRLIGA